MSSYKLIGKEFDHLCIPEECPDIILGSNDEYENTINISDLLKMKYDQLIVLKLSGLYYLYIDTIPKSYSKWLNRFYIKRVLQIIKILNDSGVRISLFTRNSEDYYRITSMIKEVYSTDAA